MEGQVGKVIQEKRQIQLLDIVLVGRSPTGDEDWEKKDDGGPHLEVKINNRGLRMLFSYCVGTNWRSSFGPCIYAAFVGK